MPFRYTAAGFLNAASSDDPRMILKYLAREDKSAFIAAKDDKGRTALHLFAARGNAEIVKKLAEAGVPVNETDASGKTALGLAVNYEYSYNGAYRNSSTRCSMLRPLIEAGADPNIHPRYYHSHLIDAIQKEDLEVVRLLLKAKADPNEGNPLSYAWKQAQAADALLEAGAKPDGADAGGLSPVHHAAKHGASAALARILDAGIDVNLQDSKGHSPLHHAVMEGQREIVELLLSRGASIGTEDAYSLTPVAWARSKNNAPITGLLEAAERQALSRAATPLTSGVNILPDETAETWVLMGSHRAACVGVFPDMGRKLTEIFNFESRQHVMISENLKTGAENLTQPVSFDQLEERALQKALDAFRALGGQADDEAVFGARKAKKTLKPAEF